MSWIDRIKNDLIITCGDGKSYTPSWLNASKDLSWNVAEFTFPGLGGTLVKKTQKLGTRFNLELFFQGPEHLDISAAFEVSANDLRPWILEHPFYGVLTVQAPSFHIDNSGLNISKWTGVVIETITEDNPKTTVDPIDEIAIQKLLLDESFAQALLATPSTTDVATMQTSNPVIYNLTVPIIKIPKEVEDYFNLFNKANAAISTAIASPLLAMRTIITMITAPAKFKLSVTQRINTLNDTFESLRSTVSGLINPASKQIYQNLAGSVISSMALATSTPLAGDFINSKRSLQLIDIIIAAYNQYIKDLDLLQTANGGNTTSFIPNAQSLQGLNQLLNLAVSNLFAIALSSKMERSIITEADTNLIILTHRFYGLDANDNNIDELIANNEMGLNSLIQIKKGTKIVYYI